MHRREFKLLALVLTSATVMVGNYAWAQDSLASMGRPVPPNAATQKETPQPAATTAPAGTTPEEPEASANSASAAASALLTGAFDAYRTNPSPATFQEVLKAFKQLLCQPGLGRMPAAAVVKSYPVLQDLGARAIDAGSGRIWMFAKAPSHDHVIQWPEIHQTVSFVGRRHRIKKVSTSVTWHCSILSVPNDVFLKEAKVLPGPEGTRLILAGEQQGSSLWVQAYRAADGTWVPSASQLDSVPPFLRQNVSGKVQFRGADLIFTVAQTVSAKNAGIINQPIAEAESSTYRFWLHLTDNGYILEPHLPDESQFWIVRQFIDSLSANRTDAAKACLADPRLISIAKYLGLASNHSSSFRVAELAQPPSGSTRFRLITGSKDDVIFEVGKFKGQTLIKAIFVAPPDNWVQQIAKVLPPYDRLVPPAPKPDENNEGPGAKH